MEKLTTDVPRFALAVYIDHGFQPATASWTCSYFAVDEIIFWKLVKVALDVRRVHLPLGPARLQDA